MAALEKTYTQEITLRDRILEIKKKENMSIVELSKKVRYSRSAISQYLANKYNSNPTEIESRLTEFVKTYEAESGEQPATVYAKGGCIPAVRPKIQYFESRDFVQTIGICKACQENMALGIVVAKSGYGKTHTLKKYAKMPRVVYIEGNETMNCKDIVRRLESRIGMPKGHGSIDERMEKIIDFFNYNEGYLIIVDEADKLINKYTQKKIELLRNITDSADVGLVIAGEPILETLMKSFDVRFTNRMDFYYKLRGLTEQEVRDYLEGYDMDEAAMAEFISRAQNTQTGCFRLLDRTLNNVIRILRDSGKSKVTMKVLSQASDMMLL